MSHFCFGSDLSRYQPNWSVSAWFIDAVAGSDANDGQTALTPLRTGRELQARLGPYAWWVSDVTITVGQGGVADGLVLSGYVAAGKHVDVIGTPTLLADGGTIASYSTASYATPEAWIFSCTLIPDFTPYQWARARLTSGTLNAVCWIAKAGPAAFGLNVARSSNWARLNETSTTTTNSSATPAVGNSVVIESLPQVKSLSLNLDGPISQLAAAQYPQRQSMIRSLAIGSLRIVASGALHKSRVIVCDSRIEDHASALPSVESSFNQASFDACLLMSTDPQNNFVNLNRFANRCLVGNTGYLNFVGGSISALLVQGVPVYISGNVSFSGFVFDVPGAGAAVTVGAQAGSVLSLSSLAGTNICPTGLALYNGSRVSRTGGSYNLRGATQDVQLASDPVVNLTMAQAGQPNDWEQKGITPALVAGTTTVTVPWYDSAIQRVTVSHAVFAGTPGILSVQQISNTQFVVTSSSALDTSTVNWIISPLGRGIYWSN